MANFSWQRVGRSVHDVFRIAEQSRAMIARALAWVALLGLPVVAFLEPDKLLPPRPWGLVVWVGTVVAALTLGVLAVYRLRSEREDEAAIRRSARAEDRRPVVISIHKLARGYQRLQHAASSAEIQGACEAIAGSLSSYIEASERLGAFEAEQHVKLQAEIESALAGEPMTKGALIERLSSPVYEALAYTTHFGGRGIELDDEEWALIQSWLAAGPKIQAMVEELHRRGAAPPEDPLRDQLS